MLMSTGRTAGRHADACACISWRPAIPAAIPHGSLGAHLPLCGEIVKRRLSESRTSYRR